MSSSVTPLEPHRTRKDFLKHDFYCTIITGFASAAVFNPWDKALYLSVKENRRFLAPLNWRQPFSGMLQAATSRVLNTGLYFPLESSFYSYSIRHLPATSSGLRGDCKVRPAPGEPLKGLPNDEKFELNAGERGKISLDSALADASSTAETGSQRHLNVAKHEAAGLGGEAKRHAPEDVSLKPNTLALFLAGNLAGFSCAALSHPLSVTKYAYWNENGRNFLSAFRHLYHNGGMPILYRGFAATMARDTLFGGVYTCLRHHLMSHWSESFGSSSGDSKSEPPAGGGFFLSSFVLNTAAACVAVAASSPLNYVRNMQFAAPTEAPAPRTYLVLRGLARKVVAAEGSSAKLAVLGRSLLLGWGTLRAAVGMGFGAFVFDFCKGGYAHQL